MLAINTHLNRNSKTKSCDELLSEYKSRCRKNGFPKAKPLIFDLQSNETVKQITKPFDDHKLPAKALQATEILFYNPTRIIETHGKKWLALRVEPKSSEKDAHVMFFEERDGMWELVPESPHLELQDPFYIENIHGFKILGGVEILDKPKPNGNLNYRTVFYRFRDKISEIEAPFAVGPDGMKDIRLIELQNGRIGVFTRPQGGSYGPGKIGYTEIDRLEDLSKETIKQAPIIEDQFLEEEWGGVNDLHLLADGRIGVLGHIAHMENNGYRKDYYSTAFIFDPKTRKATPMKIIASADDVNFKTGRKNLCLGQVLFSGGLKLEGDKAELYAGINDVQAVCFEIENPFKSEGEWGDDFWENFKRRINEQEKGWRVIFDKLHIIPS